MSDVAENKDESSSADADAEEQRQEMLALDSILNDLDDGGGGDGESNNNNNNKKFTYGKMSEAGGQIGGRLECTVDLADAGARIAYSVHNPYLKNKLLSGGFNVSHLPPVRLNFRLPPDYPSTNRPRFHLSCPWMSAEQLARLGSRLEELWAENAGGPVLFLWMGALQEDAVEVAGGVAGSVEVDVSGIVDAELNKKISRWKAEDLEEKAAAEEAADEGGAKAVTSAEAVLEDETHLGTVEKWVASRAFGFVRDDDGDGRYFFHKKNVVGVGGWAVKKGDRVRFRLVNNEDGKAEAAEVRPVTADAAVAIDEVYKVPVDAAGRLVVAKETKEKEEDRMAERLKHHVPSLVNLLKEHNLKEEGRLFARTRFSCQVCFEEKAGARCLRFRECGHVFCRECMAAHFAVRIADGQVGALACPEVGCEATALPDEVRAVVPADLFARYESKLLETTLTSMPDVVLCPRRHCQLPTVIQSREDGIARCADEACAFAFCIYCRAAYHGRDPCHVRSKEHEELIKRYLNADPAGKEALERRYGRGQLGRLADEYLSESYKEENSRRCPKCSAPIQKSHGCNKMTCNNCNTHFCYLCGARLPAANPYSHYSGLGSECFNRLFEGMDFQNDEMFDLMEGEDDDDDEDGERGGMMDEWAILAAAAQ